MICITQSNETKAFESSESYILKVFLDLGVAERHGTACCCCCCNDIEVSVIKKSGKYIYLRAKGNSVNDVQSDVEKLYVWIEPFIIMQMCAVFTGLTIYAAQCVSLFDQSHFVFDICVFGKAFSDADRCIPAGMCSRCTCQNLIFWRQQISNFFPMNFNAISVIWKFTAAIYKWEWNPTNRLCVNEKLKANSYLMQSLQA